MEFIRAHLPTPFVDFVVNSIDCFTLIDIGCAGGICHSWRQFGSALHAWGFDAMVDDVARLTAAEQSENIQYFAGMVEGTGKSWNFPGRNPSPRLSYWRTLQAREGHRWTTASAQVPPHYVMPPIADSNLQPAAAPSALALSPCGQNGRDDVLEDLARLENRWYDTETSMKSIRIVDFLASNDVEDIDFIKIDVDGPDWDILKALGPTLRSSKVLGVAAEVNFFGSDGTDEHTFHNTDRFMRASGFELFHLSMRRYSSAELPARYLYGFPASTVTGRPLQGDAIYLRDFGWELESARPELFSAQKHAKLVALFALFDLPDMAAETLQRARDRLADLLDVDAGLDILARQAGCAVSYAEHIALFEANDPRFYNGSECSDAMPEQ